MEAHHSTPPPRGSLSSPPRREIFQLKVKVTYRGKRASNHHVDRPALPGIR